MLPYLYPARRNIRHFTDGGDLQLCKGSGKRWYLLAYTLAQVMRFSYTYLYYWLSASWVERKRSWASRSGLWPNAEWGDPCQQLKFSSRWGTLQLLSRKRIGCVRTCIHVNSELSRLTLRFWCLKIPQLLLDIYIGFSHTSFSYTCISYPTSGMHT